MRGCLLPIKAANSFCVRARHGFVDDASLRDHGPRCVEEIIGRGGLERIWAGETNGKKRGLSLVNCAEL